MRIQLIHPPLYINPRALTALRPAPPLGLAYIAAALEKAGHDCQVLDAIAEAPQQTQPAAGGRLLSLGLSIDEIIARVDRQTGAFAITNMWSFCWPMVRALIIALHEACPDIPIVCGGEHFTGMPRESMQQAPIDYIVMGEGEAIAVALFARLEKAADELHGFNPADIDGLVWRDGAEIVVNQRAPRIKDVDSLPWPAWDKFDLHTYSDNNFVTGIKFGITVPILATRGCPYQCTYCPSPNMWTTRWHARDPIDVVNEIEHYHRHYGATNFPFQDLTAIIRKDWVIAFCHELIRRELNINWQMPTGTRCDVVDSEVAELLYRSGGRTMSFAPESGSEKTRKLIKKRMKTANLMRAVKAASDARLNVAAFLVIGFPHDTMKDLLQTLRLAHTLAKMGVEDVACAFFLPIPSTELYQYLLDSGRIVLTDSESFDEFLMSPIFVHDVFLSSRRNYCEHMSAATLTVMKYLIVATFYLTQYLWRPANVIKRLRNLWQDKEESKMDTFLIETKRKFRAKLGF